MPSQPEPVVVSQASFESDDPAGIVYSNVTFVNALFDALLEAEEIPPDALRSYYVDYYLAQLENGGFAQFVYNCRWQEPVVTMVREGLEAMGASRHLGLFDEASALVTSLGQERLETFFEGGYFGDDPERDHLNALNDGVDAALHEEDLCALNAAWLRGRPQLEVLSEAAIAEAVARRAEAMPDRDERIARVEANRPEHEVLIRALCERAGHELVQVTAGDPTHIQDGQQLLAWHFLTKRGRYYMVEKDGRAIMYGAISMDPVAELSRASSARQPEAP